MSRFVGEIPIHCAYDDLVKISELKGHPKNRNKHSKEQIDRLAKIIKYQGIRSPIKISKRSGFITAGHGRLEAFKMLKLKAVPINNQDYDSEEQEYADVQSDNAIASWAELDLSGINTDIVDLGPDFDIDILGIKDFVLEPADKQALCDEDEIPDKVEPKAKLGDIYKLGQHRLMCGDSTNIDAVDKMMDGEKADMVFTDPPYNQTTTGGTSGPIGSAFAKQSREIEHMCDFNPKEFLAILPIFFQPRVMNISIFCNKDLVVDYLQWAREMKLNCNILIWKKPNAIPIGGSYRPDVEYLMVLRQSGVFNANLDGVSYSKVLEHGREKYKVHPTMKPVALLENQILIASKERVVDLFGGSGSTLIACEKTNRKCFMMEIDPHYVDVIIARYEKYTGNKAELINGKT